MGGLSPWLGTVSEYPWPITRAHDRIALGGGMLFLIVLKDVSLGGSGTGSSDNVGHVPVWDTVRSLFPYGDKGTWVSDTTVRILDANLNEKVVLCIYILMYLFFTYYSIYVSSYCSVYVSSYCPMCPHTVLCVLILFYVSSYCSMCPHIFVLLVLLYICVLIYLFSSYWSIYVSSYYSMCPHTVLYMCPHTTLYLSFVSSYYSVYVSSYYYMYLSSYYSIYVSSYYSIYVSSYYSVCVLILLYICVLIYVLSWYSTQHRWTSR
jgi:hypothetical protein